MKKTVAVIFGGKSAEHDVSIITAHLPIISSLISSGKFEVIPIYISKEGKWYSDEKMLDLDYFKNNLDNKLNTLRTLDISLNDGLRIIRTGFFSKKIKIDIVFPAMHGTYGEDGSLMGLLRMANVPFVGCDISASTIAMDKSFTKQILASADIATVPFIYFTKKDWEGSGSINILEKIENLKYPLFVKPVHLGSSIGIAKTKDIEELKQAVEVALHYDNKVLIEESVENLIEVTLPIMGNSELTLGAIERPLNKTSFFDFQEKYLGENGKKNNGRVNNNYSEIPAKISEELSKEIEYLGKKTYKILGCSGISRIDFLIDSSVNKVYVNEVNTLPGGLYDHNWRKTGVSNVELVTKLIDLALEKFDEKRAITHTFSSEILNNLNSAKLG